MKPVALQETENATGPNDPRNRLHFADGKRVTKAEFARLRSEAMGHGELNNIYSYTSGGLRHYHATAWLPE